MQQKLNIRLLQAESAIAYGVLFVEKRYELYTAFIAAKTKLRQYFGIEVRTSSKAPSSAPNRTATGLPMKKVSTNIAAPPAIAIVRPALK